MIPRFRGNRHRSCDKFMSCYDVLFKTIISAKKNVTLLQFNSSTTYLYSLSLCPGGKMKQNHSSDPCSYFPQRCAREWTRFFCLGDWGGLPSIDVTECVSFSLTKLLIYTFSRRPNRINFTPACLAVCCVSFHILPSDRVRNKYTHARSQTRFLES